VTVSDLHRPALRMAPGDRPAALRLAGCDGFTLLELLFVLAIALTMMGMAVGEGKEAVDAVRTSLAARALAGKLAGLRMDAVTRSQCLALRFEPVVGDYTYSTYTDGNGNGVRTVDISAGVDAPLGPGQRLANTFPGVSFGLMNGYPDADLTPGTGSDGVRIGSARILTLSPDGTATAGTLYLHGRRSQYAIRILGSTGRVRVLQYVPSEGTWQPR
jgi:prepilin-type N-terminal cleavage/methylation domain-containing protein